MSKLNQRSWGAKYESDLKPMGDYTICPYESCSHRQEDGFLSCIVGYDKDFNLLIVECPVCSRRCTVHGLETTFSELARRVENEQMAKRKKLRWFEYAKAYEVMCQCIKEAFKEYEDVLRDHLKRLKAKLGHIPPVDFDSSWDLGDEQINCFSTANNLEILQTLLGISNSEAKEIRRKLEEDLTS